MASWLHAIGAKTQGGWALVLMDCKIRFIQAAKWIACFAATVLSLGCSVNNLESITGPSPAAANIKDVVQTPQAPALTLPPSELFTKGDPNAPDVEEKPVDPNALPETKLDVPMLLALQEDRSQFIGAIPWRAIASLGGIDAANSEGTICSARMESHDTKLNVGMRFIMACSDGQSAELEILAVNPMGASGQMKLGRITQNVGITYGL